MRKIFHGSRDTAAYLEIRIQKYNKDFYRGFYCTELESQAIRWATRFGRPGVINVYTYSERLDLSVKKFPEMSEEWLDFIVACRSGIPHSFDVVEGPTADDAIFNYIQSFLDGEISRAAFWELAVFIQKMPSRR